MKWEYEWPLNPYQSLCCAIVKIFHITAPRTQLWSTKLIDFWDGPHFALILRNVEIGSMIFYDGELYIILLKCFGHVWFVAHLVSRHGRDGRTENPRTYLASLQHRSFLAIPLTIAFGQKLVEGKISTIDQIYQILKGHNRINYLTWWLPPYSNLSYLIMLKSYILSHMN